ncbi:TldD/PmbA family protein [Piscinibacter sakaiensis]|uniref:TldE/PmbA family protein n=1 Tax=Piscinibacter sakaiensis TaxID=1547922 RepID=A0A0K8P469_PISS1|nr:metallopeptidase TldD-related protein [Piscinibacter sakaiensis]GAP37406.1 TldE/PmbA family protein [Piscinibacter sakaiensis]
MTTPTATPTPGPDAAPACVTPAYFEALCTLLADEAGGAHCSLLLKAEASDFVRFNRGAVRQATQVQQAYATLAVAADGRRIASTLSLSGRPDEDLARLRAEAAVLRTQLPELPADPYLLLPPPATSHRHETGQRPPVEALVAQVARAAAGLDFVGFYAGGPVVRAYADNAGARHWHHVDTFHVDWCLYHAADKAVKSAYAGATWSDEAFAERVAEAARRLPLLARPPRVLPAGAYRAYFTPTAMVELLGTLGWSGFGLKARRTGTSSLMRLAHQDAALHPALQLHEDTAHGLAPAFTEDGFAKPARVPLVLDGRAADTLNSPRTAREYGVAANGANPEERPLSLDLAGGTLPEEEVLAALDTGLYVSDLWYLNYSDRLASRMTGMTRFACFWVERGRLVEPLQVMRFDDAFLRMFGDGLLALTDRPERIPDNSSYLERQLAGTTTPGALVEGWRLTL